MIFGESFSAFKSRITGKRLGGQPVERFRCRERRISLSMATFSTTIAPVVAKCVGAGDLARTARAHQYRPQGCDLSSYRLGCSIKGAYN
jgi:hypothetical protein